MIWFQASNLNFVSKLLVPKVSLNDQISMSLKSKQSRYFKGFLILHTSHVSQTLCKAWFTFVFVNRISHRAKRKSDCQVSKVRSKNLKEMLSGHPKVWNVWNLADTRLVRDPHVGIAGVTSECENSEAVQKAHIWWKCELQVPRLCFWHNKLEAAHKLTIIARLSRI